MAGTEQRSGQGGMGQETDLTALVRRDSSLDEPQIVTPDLRYTFQTFIVGSNNHFAHAAALSIAERPGRSYNPLFLYGGIGLGKTHLLHAIWQHAKATDQERRIIYVDGQQLGIELAKATREHRREEFRKEYSQQVDMLLIDNIQLFLGEIQAREEFFHIFNNLHANRRQVVVTSDRAPRSMRQLDDRLRSRFEKGLIVEIAPPNLETRMAIVRVKAGEQQAILTDDVCDLLAGRFTGDIQELEGAVNRVIAYCRAHEQTINLDTVNEALAVITGRASQSISVEDIIYVVSAAFGVSEEQMRGPKRHRPIVLARQVAMYLMREETSLSLADIGREMGGRDHSTATHAHERIEAELTGNPRFLRQVEGVRERLHGRKEAT